ncbi:hypothetical protein, partial [Streptomyces sp. NPDC059168]|uniref:hypothetical protein n=1 Tax=Streptomyces sp. NPDC059168 TaxID=3346753 RepID=UPI0036C36650
MPAAMEEEEEEEEEEGDVMHGPPATRNGEAPWEELVTAALLGTARRPPATAAGREAPLALLDAAAVA